MPFRRLNEMEENKNLEVFYLTTVIPVLL